MGCFQMDGCYDHTSLVEAMSEEEEEEEEAPDGRKELGGEGEGG